MRVTFSTKPKFKDIAVILFFSKDSIVNFARLLSLNTKLLIGLLLVLIYGFLFLAFIEDLHTITLDSVAVLLFVASFFYLTSRLHPEYHRVLYEFADWNIFKKVFDFFSAPFAYMVIRAQKDITQLKRDFRYIAHITFLCSCTGFLAKHDSGYNMGFGYLISLPAVLYLWMYLENRDRLSYFFLSIIAIMEGIFFGSRGCIIGYALFFAVYMVFIEDGLTKMRAAMVAAVGFAVYAFTSSTFFITLYQTVKKLGIDSRTLQKLAENSITDANARDMLFHRLIEQIRHHSVFYGFGAYGDRYILRNFYAHNIFLELIIDFGLVFGVLFLLILLIRIIRIGIVYRKEKSICSLFFVLFCFSFGRLLFSYSFWYEQTFGAMLGLSVTLLSAKTVKKIRFSRSIFGKLLALLRPEKRESVS